MKTMTCKQLGGGCDQKFQAETFDEIAEMSQAHGKEMFEQGDEAHLIAMEKTSEMMKNPAEMKAWVEAKKREFDALGED